MRTKLAIGAAVLLGLISLLLWTLMGAGGFKRMVTLTGVYAVCRPGGYDAVCFLDADSKQGGLSCLSLASVGGECKR